MNYYKTPGYADFNPNLKTSSRKNESDFFNYYNPKLKKYKNYFHLYEAFSISYKQLRF